jgi:hypothetical protein
LSNYSESSLIADLNAENTALKAQVARLEGENTRMRDGLTLLSEGDTPWLNTNTTENAAWELMAIYAKQLLEPAQGVEGG